MEKLLDIGGALGIESAKIQAAMGSGSRDEKIARLRKLGFSLSEIGKQFDLSRQRVSQIVGPGKSKPVDRRRILSVPTDIKKRVWGQAADDPAAWWHKNGKLKQQEVVEIFLDQGYNWSESRRLAKLIQVSKLDVVLFVSFGVEPNDLAQTAFFNRLADDMTKYGILAHINARQSLQVTKRLFNRKWSVLGIRAKKRAV